MLKVHENSWLVDDTFSLQRHLYVAFPLCAWGEGERGKRESRERKEKERETERSLVSLPLFVRTLALSD